MTVQILTGDALEVLRGMPEGSVHTCITSPPYWALRSYGGETGMIGLEPTFEEHLEAIIGVFREVRRVLRDDGTLWLNYGDAYAGSPNGRSAAETKDLGGDDRTFRDKPLNTAVGVWKQKDLMMMPARVAMALMDDGWWLRSEVVWAKLNPLPESIRDRPTMAHEKIYLFAKSGRTLFWTHPTKPGTRRRPEPDHVWVNRITKEVNSVKPEDDEGWARRNLWRGNDYFYDEVAVRTPIKPQSLARLDQKSFDAQTGGPKDDRAGNRSHRKTLENLKSRHRGTIRPDKDDKWGGPRQGFAESGWDNMTKEQQQAGGANLRNWWPVAAEPYRGAHFATMPTGIVEPCVKAGTSEAGVCPHCGAPWVRQTEKTLVKQYESRHGGYNARGNHKGMVDMSGNWTPGTDNVTTTGWAPSCDCPPAEPVPATVLDPFAGAGTVGLVADRLQRHAILIEINGEYAEIARKRLSEDAPLLVDLP